ncbi:MAG: hypothetical protein LBG26_03010 [Treponema sp.]|jgi:hypothetical protein|nr:hypothetical protein [Treponema sp.]
MLFQDNVRVIAGNKTLDTPDRVIHYYDIKNIEQYQGFDYEEMAERIADIMRNPQLCLNTDLIVDGTGVGEAAIEMIRKRGLYPIPIIFSGGEAPREHYTGMGEVFSGSGSFAGAKILKEISVPKKDLAGAGKVMMQQGRLRVAPGKWNGEFKKQLSKFKGKINERTGNTKYEADTEKDHDDLVVCFLMGAWWIFNRRERNSNPERTATQGAAAGWEPDDYM